METEAQRVRRWRSRVVGKCPVCGRDVWQDYGQGRRAVYDRKLCRQAAYRKRILTKLLAAERKRNRENRKL